ncbi:ATP-binding cassette domain-containing protein [Candidatus Poribacteria bacterium]|nr:ATP-binding cassette domain-containing protein [Candidatus Poribacteria bacterium]
MGALVSVLDLKKDYKVGETVVHALRGMDMEIEAGEFTAVAGPSGSGKSTLLNLIGCLDTPTEGKVLINENDVSHYSKKELANIRRESIGFIFQTFNLIPILSAFENVAFPLSLLHWDSEKIQNNVNQILKDVGLEGMEDRYPRELSGGQQQRVAVARALVKEPTIILADEPTANLDSNTGGDILDLMRELNEEKGATFIFSTHDPMVMDRARRLINLKDGMIHSDERK